MKPQIIEVCNKARLFLGGQWMERQDITVTREAWELCHRLREPSEADVKALKRILFRFDFRKEESLRKERNALMVALKEAEKAPVEPLVEAPQSNSIFGGGLLGSGISWETPAKSEPEISLNVGLAKGIGEAYKKFADKQSKPENKLSPDVLRAPRPTPEANRPAVRPIPQRARDFQIAFPRIEGKAGEIKNVSVMPQMYFRGEKFIATDDCKDGVGLGTEIVHMFVGCKAQFPPQTAMPTWAFKHDSLGSGVKFDTCPPAMHITVAVRFLKDCAWSGVIFGKGIQDSNPYTCVASETNSGKYLSASEVMNFANLR